jgi:hypothetical protein
MRPDAPLTPRPSALRRALTLAALGLAACEGAATPAEPTPAVETQRAALDEAEAETVCGASLADCLARGVGEADCRARHARCVDSLTSPGPRPDERSGRACWERFDFCVAGGEVPTERCREGLSGCLEAVTATPAAESPDAALCGPAEAPGGARCEQRYRDCVEAGEPAEACAFGLRHCLADTRAPTPTHADHVARCEARTEACRAEAAREGFDPARCDYGLRECLANPHVADPAAEAEVVACHDGYRACVTSREAPERCDEALRACLGGAAEPPASPRPDDLATRCEARLRDCLSSDSASDGPERCEAAYRECLASPPEAGAAGPDPLTVQCERDYRGCLAAGGDPDRCGLAFRSCLASPPPEAPPARDGHALRCETGFRACLAEGRPADLCEGEFRQCLANPPAPDAGDAPPSGDRGAFCDGVFAACVGAGNDPEACEARRSACRGEDAPPSPDSAEVFCRRGLESCLASATTEREGRACRAAEDACRASLAGDAR